jgi:outer membrane protein TolC
MKCIERCIGATTLALILASQVYAAQADSKQEYKQQLRDFGEEVRTLGRTGPSMLPEATQIIPNSEASRQMPPLPKKSVNYSHLLQDKTLGDLNIFREDSLEVRAPKLSGLITLQENLNPFSIDAKLSQGVNLRDLLRVGLTNNLDIRLARNDAEVAKYRYLSAVGNFLPEVGLGDNQFWTHGRLGLPIAGANGVRLNGPFAILNARVTHHVYQGGRVLFGALQQKHAVNAANANFHAGYNDTLAEIARRYYQLVLAETVLQIRMRAADTSEEQVRVASERFQHGFATNLDVLQARTQLSTDRQNLLEQQVVRRQAAIDLAALLNYDLDYDLQPSGNITRSLLVRSDASISDLLKLATENRAELKQYSELRKAAKAAIGVAAAPLQPTVDFGGAVYGLGKDAGSIDPIYLLNLNIQWRLGGLGTVDAANIAAAKAAARSVNIELQKKMVEITQGVRTAFIRSHAANQNIIEADTRVASALEELRLAEIRYRTGVGTHLDVLTAQRDYTQAQITKAEAITNFNIAQVQLVRELGLVSVENLSSEKPII